jgi:TrpR-related protein YerC/YecD
LKEHEGEDFSGIDQRLRDPLTDSLFEAILLLKDKEECYRFFQDIATIAEIKALAQRLEVAKLLEKNVTYTTIAQSTGASTATISRVKRCLYFGADGYQMVLRRIAEKENNQKINQEIEKGES